MLLYAALVDRFGGTDGDLFAFDFNGFFEADRVDTPHGLPKGTL